MNRSFKIHIISYLIILDVVKSCGSAITLNNTYWQSPTTINSGSACALTIKLNSGAVGAGAAAIAQVRYVHITVPVNNHSVFLTCVFFLAWILFRSLSASLVSIRFVARIHSLYLVQQTVCQSFVAIMLANTVINDNLFSKLNG